MKHIVLLVIVVLALMPGGKSVSTATSARQYVCWARTFPNVGYVCGVARDWFWYAEDARTGLQDLLG